MNCSKCSSSLICLDEWVCPSCGLVYGADLLPEWDYGSRTVPQEIITPMKDLKCEPPGDEEIIQCIVYLRNLLEHAHPRANLKVYSQLIQEYIQQKGPYSPVSIAACVLCKIHTDVKLSQIAKHSNVSVVTLRKCFNMTS